MKVERIYHDLVAIDLTRQEVRDFKSSICNDSIPDASLRIAFHDNKDGTGRVVRIIARHVDWAPISQFGVPTHDESVQLLVEWAWSQIQKFRVQHQDDVIKPREKKYDEPWPDWVDNKVDELIAAGNGRNSRKKKPTSTQKSDSSGGVSIDELLEIYGVE